MKQIPSEPYPELHEILEKFTAGVQNALAENFVGAYLIGSLATGDFDLDSDIDFLIVTNAELTEAQLRSLQALHIEIYGLGCYPAKHLEGSYISRGVLAQADLVGVQPLWYVTMAVHSCSGRCMIIGGAFGGFCASVQSP